MNTKELGALIRQRRKERGMTQTDLAEYSGSSVMFISQLENGKETAQVGKVMRVLGMLALDVHIKEREQR